MRYGLDIHHEHPGNSRTQSLRSFKLQYPRGDGPKALMIGEINFAAICLDDGTVFGRKPFIGLFLYGIVQKGHDKPVAL